MTPLYINPDPQEWTLAVDEHQQIVLVFNTAQSEPVNLKVYLQGQGASLEILGVIALSTPHVLQCTIEVVHAAPNTISKIILASVLKGEAAQEVKGKIVIQKGAKGADGFLSHRTLTLSSHAKSITIPSLEIEEEDVKAGHEGVTGPVDQQQLFYLHTRGLDQASAQELVVEGFLSTVIGKIKDASIKEQVTALCHSI